MSFFDFLSHAGSWQALLWAVRGEEPSPGEHRAGIHQAWPREDWAAETTGAVDMAKHRRLGSPSAQPSPINSDGSV